MVRPEGVSLIKRLYAALFAAAAFGSTSAAAQTTTAPVPQLPPSPTVIVWYAGLATGVTGASKAGFPFNGEAGMRVWRDLDVSVEVGWFSNVVTKRGSDAANQLAAFLQQTQGQPASASVKVRAVYGTVNARWVLESQRRYRPYALFGMGGARVSPKTKFTLGGTPVNASQYGVTLGQDLASGSGHGALTVGLGVVVPYGRWYGDVGYRLTSILTTGGSTNVNRLMVGAGARF